MKKILFFTVLVGVIGFTSCNKTNLDKVTPTSISFGTAVGSGSAQTKATSTTLTSLGTDGFYVYGYQTNGLWNAVTNSALSGLSNKRVTYTAPSWTYDSPVLWPASNRVSFFAFSPAAATNSIVYSAPATAANSAPSIAFTTQATAAAQVDLVTAQTMNTSAYLSPSNLVNNKVKMVFRHALSAIGFKFRQSGYLGNATAKARVRSVQVAVKQGKNATATFTFATTTSTTGTEAGAWSAPATFLASSVYTKTDSHVLFDDLVTGTNYLVLNNGNTTGQPDHYGNYKDLYNEGLNHYLMLIPQIFNAGDLMVRITYEYSAAGDWNDTKSFTYPDGPGAGVTSIGSVNYVSLPQLATGASTLQNRRYFYCFTISGMFITFDNIEVDNWTDVTPDVNGGQI